MKLREKPRPKSAYPKLHAARRRRGGGGGGAKGAYFSSEGSKQLGVRRPLRGSTSATDILILRSASDLSSANNHPFCERPGTAHTLPRVSPLSPSASSPKATMFRSNSHRNFRTPSARKGIRTQGLATGSAAGGSEGEDGVGDVAKLSQLLKNSEQRGDYEEAAVLHKHLSVLKKNARNQEAGVWIVKHERTLGHLRVSERDTRDILTALWSRRLKNYREQSIEELERLKVQQHSIFRNSWSLSLSAPLCLEIKKRKKLIPRIKRVCRTSSHKSNALFSLLTL